MSSSLGHEENAMKWRTRATKLKVEAKKLKVEADKLRENGKSELAIKKENQAREKEQHAQKLEDHSNRLVRENKRTTEEQKALRELASLEEEVHLNKTLRDGSRLRNTARQMRDDLRTSEQSVIDTKRVLAEQNEELRRLATLTGINVDELSYECPVTSVRPPVEPRPPPSQPIKLKLWLKRIGQAINCSGPQGGKKTRKHRKYRNKSRKHKKFKKSKKHKNKRNKKHTKKHKLH